jgi:uncharacterized protein (DUF433 family)
MWEALVMNAQHNSITTDPLRRGGRPCVRDLHVSVGDVLGWLAMGQTAEQIVADYPELTLADIRGCLAYAADRESHEVWLAAAAWSCGSTRICHRGWRQSRSRSFQPAHAC